MRRFFDLGPNIRRNRHQVMARDVFPNLVQVFGYVPNKIFRRRMLVLDLFENFNGRFVWIDFLCGIGKRFLFRF